STALFFVPFQRVLKRHLGLSVFSLVELNPAQQNKGAQGGLVPAQHPVPDLKHLAIQRLRLSIPALASVNVRQTLHAVQRVWMVFTKATTPGVKGARK